MIIEEEENEDLKIGKEISVLLSIANEIKGIFTGWRPKSDESSGRFMLIEQKYENYILSLARLLDSNDLTLEEFKAQMKIDVYERNKIRKIDERHIFRLNDRPFLVE